MLSLWGAETPWQLFVPGSLATISQLRRHWDESLALSVQHAIQAFGFPAYQHPPPSPHLTPAGHCRSIFVSGMTGRGASAPTSVTGSIIHTANSYAITGLEMEQVKEGQGKHTRFDLTQRPLLLSSSGNASHALLLLPQAPQIWARALYPEAEGSTLPAAVKARIGAVEAALTMAPALAHLHMPHTGGAAQQGGLGAWRVLWGGWGVWGGGGRAEGGGRCFRQGLSGQESD